LPPPTRTSREGSSLGKFREDLYYRLKVVELVMPPLRERKEDIPLLVEHFLAKCAGKARKSIKGLSREAEKLFMEYHWPGNVRELEHAIEHACIVCHNPVIETADLPPELRESIPAAKGMSGHEIILKTLDRTDWNISKAAKLLGISRPHLYKKIREIKARGETDDDKNT
jgi:DNA-binding NtrC family response regulator